MSYLWIPAIPVTVTERMDAFRWDEETHRILYIAESWRIDAEWWRMRVWRDYYRMVTHRGYLVVIYQDLLSREWYLQQLHD